MDVAPQEERMVSAHLESCESCAKFHHQLQQVIMAAEEVPLPDEMAPNPPEALARNIMEGLPQPKASPFDFIIKLFAKKEKAPTVDRNSDRNASKFPHVNRSQSGDGMDMPRKEMAMPSGKGDKGDDHSGTSNRLRAIAKGAAYEGREAQSTTRSLGEKLGFAAPAGNLTDDQPLTLAESIRRKISETKPPGQGDDDEDMAPLAPPEPVSAGDDSWGRPASSPSRPPANMASPPNLQGGKQQAPMPAQAAAAEPGQTVLGSWGKPSPIDNSNSWGGQANAAGPAVAAGGSKDDWNFDAAANPGQPMAAQAHGGIDPFAAPSQATSNPNMQQPNPATDSWGGWNESAPKGAGAASAEAPDSDWGPPPQGGTWDEPAAAGAPASSNSWGGAPANPAQISAANAPKAFMETGMIKLGELGLPSMQQAPAVAQPMQQPVQQPPPNPGFPQQQQVGTGSDTGTPALSNSWGGVAQSPSAAPAGAADPWGSASTDSWGASPEQRSWGPQTSSAENPVPAAAAQWGQPAAPQENFGGKPAADWAEPASADSWGGAPSQGSWSQPPVPTSWDQTGSEAGAQPAWGEGNDWAQSGQPGAPQAVPEQHGSSSQAAALGKGRQQAWSLEAEQVETGTWRAFAPSGESLSGAAAAPGRAPEPSPQVAKETQSFAPQDEQSRWDIPIQERMKQGQSATQSGTQHPLPPMPVAPPSPFSQPTFAQAAGAAAPMAPPPAPKPPEPMALPDSPAPTKSGWNFPVYEAPDQLTHIPNEPKVAGAWDSPATVVPSAPPQPAPSMSMGGAWGQPPTPGAPPPAPEPRLAGAWDMPSAPSFPQPQPTPQPTPQPMPQPLQMAAPQGNPTQQGLSLPVDSIMDRLGNVLSNNADAQSAPAAQAQSPWDVSIQERQQQQQQSPWGQVPEPAAPPAMPGNGAGWNAQPVAQPAQVQAFQAPGPAPVSNNPWDSVPVGPGPSPFALPQPAIQQPVIPSAWDNPNPAASPAQPLPLPVAQQASVAAATAAPAASGLFQNLDDNAIDRLFSENLGVNDAGAGPGPASQFPGGPRAAPQTAPAPAFTAPRWNPGENGGSTGAAPSFSNVSPGSQAAAPQPFSAPPAQQPVADAGGPKISAITPRAAAPVEAPAAAMPGPDRRNTPFGMPAPAPAPPQPMAASQPLASPFAAPQPVSESAKANGLFDLDDSAMDELFSKNLGVNEAATPLPNSPAQQPQQGAPVFQSPPVMAQQPAQPAMPPANPFSRPAPQMPPSTPNPFAPLAAPQPAAPPTQQPAWGQQPPAPPLAPHQQQPGQPGTGGLFSIDDSMIDKIFADNALPQPPAAPQFNVKEAVKEFAEVVPMPPPKIAGVGRLDPRLDTTADSGSGRIASIGKFLLDQKDLEKIGKLTGSDLSETKMRILTMEAAQELQTLLHHIGTQETVVGSVIVGHDGLLIANTMPPDIDAESIGVWALGVYMATEMVIKKMGQDRVHQIVSRTPKGYVVIADFGGGLLVTVSDGKDTDTLIPLMRSITQLVAQ